MELFLVRHGETTGDIEDRYGGMYDDHLTEKGRAQLKETAEKLSGRQVDVIYTSTLIRAKEASDIINEQLKTRIELSDGLRERDYGVLGGLTKQEALEKYPEAVEAHKNSTNTDPGGESQLDFITRVTDTFESIVAENHETIIIVSHGGVLKVILKHMNKPIPDSIGDGEIIEVKW